MSAAGLMFESIRDLRARIHTHVGGFGELWHTDGAEGNCVRADGIGSYAVTLAQLKALAQEFGTDDIAVHDSIYGVSVEIRRRTR